jgi:muramoyltetrapeptide carboxypeptidase
LRVEIAAHAFDSWGHYLAGRDQDRLADLDEAFRDPGVRAVLSTTGGKGSYRIVDRLDFGAIGRDPKPFVGFSDLTSVHLARWQRSGVPGFHGPHMAWNDDYYGAVAAERLRVALMEAQALVIQQDPREPTGKWSMIDVLGERLSSLGIPVLGGLPIGHGPAPFTVPLGTLAHLDAGAGALTVEPGVS